MTCAEAKQAAASESAIRGKDPINHIPWYDMQVISRNTEGFCGRASGDAVCFQVVLQGNQNATYIDTSMHYLMCIFDPRSMDSCPSA